MSDLHLKHIIITIENMSILKNRNPRVKPVATFSTPSIPIYHLFFFFLLMSVLVSIYKSFPSRIRSINEITV